MRLARGGGSEGRGPGGSEDGSLSSPVGKHQREYPVLGGISVSHGGGIQGSSPGEKEDAPSVVLPSPKDNAFLEFVAPGKVEVRHEELDEDEAVGDGKVLVQAICSSISSGTELKVC